MRLSDSRAATARTCRLCEKLARHGCHGAHVQHKADVLPQCIRAAQRSQIQHTAHTDLVCLSLIPTSRGPLPPRPLSSGRLPGPPSAAASWTSLCQGSSQSCQERAQGRAKGGAGGVGDTLEKRVGLYRCHCTSVYIRLCVHLSLHLYLQWRFFVHICERWRPSASQPVRLCNLRRVCFSERHASPAP